MINDFDKEITRILKTEIDRPIQFEYSIKNAFIEKNSNTNSLLYRVLTIISILLMFCSCVFATSYIVYQKIWVEPRKYISYKEFYENDKFINREKEVNKDSIQINTDTIKDFANTLLVSLDYDEIIDIPDIEEPSEILNEYTIIKNNLELKYNVNGELKSFVDFNNEKNYNIVGDKISKETATKIAMKILNVLSLEKKYKMKNIQEISSIYESNEKKIWYAQFYDYENNVINDYQKLFIYFYLQDNNIMIEQILIFDDAKTFGYEYDNNEIIIDKDKAIEIALSKNNEICDLEVQAIDVELSVKDINAFVYAQEQSNGIEDTIAYENSVNTNLAFHQYEISYTLRNVWNVKITYDIDSNSKNLIKTWKENFGRNYYIDSTTGEIIGGSWGDSWNK